MRELNPHDLVLDEMKRLGRDQVADTFQDLALADMLHGLELGVYAEPGTKRHWIGSTRADVHTHDRWLYIHYRENWYELTPERLLPIWNYMAVYAKVGITRRLKNDHLRYLEADITLTSAWRRQQELAPLSVGQITNYGRLLITKSYKVVSSMGWHGSDVDLHDAIYHHETWRGKLGLDASLPRELLLRMYGLGEVLDYVPLVGEEKDVPA